MKNDVIQYCTIQHKSNLYGAMVAVSRGYRGSVKNKKYKKVKVVSYSVMNSGMLELIPVSR